MHSKGGISQIPQIVIQQLDAIMPSDGFGEEVAPNGPWVVVGKNATRCAAKMCGHFRNRREAVDPGSGYM